MTQRLSINQKLDQLLKNQEQMLKYERKILREEEKIEEFEEQELQEEISEDEALKRLEALQLDMKEKLGSPLTKVTKHDVLKGFIGASLGVISHFAFAKAIDLSEFVSVQRATLLYIVAFLVIIIMLYYTGFRKIEKQVILKFMPLRALVLYSVSIATIIIVYFLFGVVEFPIPYWDLYRLVGTSVLLASMGAATADLLGRVSE